MADNANADTSAQPKPGETTPAGTDTSAKTDENTVVLTKEQHEEQQRLIAIGQGAQKQLARYERVFGKIDGKKGGHFKQEQTPPASNENGGTPPASSDDKGLEEDRKAERLLLGLAVDPAYREVLDADPTLRSLLTSNPLGILPILAPDALDAQDALELVKEKLEERKKTLTSTTTTPPATEKVETTTTPPAGGVNTQNTDQDAEYEAARKVGNTEQAVAGMVKIGIKKMNKK